MPRRTVLLATLGLLGGSLSALQGALGPGEFQVNTTTGDQGHPAVAMDDAGNFVVVWQSAGPAGSSAGSAILAQRFDASGMKLGGEFPVNTSAAVSRYAPAVAMHPATGKFLVAWTGLDGNNATLNAVRLQLFDVLGEKVGGEFQIDNHFAVAEQNPAVAVDRASGNFVVVWDTRRLQGGDKRGDVLGQLFDSAGGRVGEELPINLFKGELDLNPQVAFDDGGNFVVVWGDGDELVRAERFDRSGQPREGAFEVSARPDGYTYVSNPSTAAAPAGNFVVSWVYSGFSHPSGPFSIVEVTPYGASGGPLSDSATIAHGYEPRIAVDSFGDFLLTSLAAGSRSYDVVGQRLTNYATAIGPQFRISTGGVDHAAPAIATGASGRAVAAWTSKGGQDGDGSGIFARLLELRALGSVCSPSPSILCIDSLPGDKRFEVEVSYSTVQVGGLAGSALAVPLASIGFSSAGLFAFADPGTPDVMVKLLDACAFAQSRWFFFSGSTNFGFTMKIIDTLTGLTRVYTNPDLTAVAPVADFTAFPCP